MRFVLAAGLCVAGVSAALAQRTGVFDQSMNHPAIKYSTADSTTVVDELNRRLADGAASQLAVMGYIGGRGRPASAKASARLRRSADACAQLPQFLDERFQRLTDAPVRRRALLHQLELDSPLSLRCFPSAHCSILAQLSP